MENPLEPEALHFSKLINVHPVKMYIVNFEVAGKVEVFSNQLPMNLRGTGSA